MESLARDRDPAAILVGSVTVLLKAAGAALALALARRRPPPRALVVVATVAGLALAVYGLASIVGAAAGLTGLAGPDADRTALGHALLWDPWFVLWGIALWQAARTARTGRVSRGW